MRAIEINGAAIEMNKQAFTWGRLAAHDMSRVRSVIQFKSRAGAPAKSLDEQIAIRADFLTNYQDKAYADRYLDAVAKVRKAEAAAAPASTELSEAVAKNLFKLMAYKDEYEVARLYTDGSFAKKLSDKLDGDYQIKFYLAPPIFAKRDRSGRLMKKEYGGWMLGAFKLLAKLKGLRGTSFDPFGRTEERKMERRLVEDYFGMIDQRVANLKPAQIPLLAKLARGEMRLRSHVRIAAKPEDLSTVRIANGGADLILGCDMVVSAGPTALSRVDRGVTKAFVNADMQPTASFVQNPDIDFEIGAMQTALRDAIGERNLEIIDATGIAATLMGDSIATNPFMLGFAFQKGAIPLSLEALLRAIEINGAAIEMNKQAFTWGRLAAHDMSRVRSVIQFKSRAGAPAKSLDEQIALRADFLTNYQDKAYADRYLAAVEKVRKAEAAAAPASTELTEAVAKNLFKLMAYKDEYEVARLYTDGSFAKKLSDKFDGDYQIKFYLAPPIFAKRDRSGRLMKKEYGGWMLGAFKLLAKLKGLRGTSFDPFGRTEERKMERRLVEDYFGMIDQRIANLKPAQIPLLAKLARLPETIRGYGHIKEENVKKAAAEKAAAGGRSGEQPVRRGGGVVSVVIARCRVG